MQDMQERMTRCFQSRQSQQGNWGDSETLSDQNEPTVTQMNMKIVLTPPLSPLPSQLDEPNDYSMIIDYTTCLNENRLSNTNIKKPLTSLAQNKRFLR